QNAGDFLLHAPLIGGLAGPIMLRRNEGGHWSQRCGQAHLEFDVAGDDALAFETGEDGVGLRRCQRIAERSELPPRWVRVGLARNEDIDYDGPIPVARASLNEKRCGTHDT